MKSLVKKPAALLLGIGVLASSVAPVMASTPMDPENGAENSAIISQQEVNKLLEIYQPDVPKIATHVKVKIYNGHDHLIYSDKVELNKIDSDIRLNALINSSDYLTEIDNTKIYKLK